MAQIDAQTLEEMESERRLQANINDNIVRLFEKAKKHGRGQQKLQCRFCGLIRNKLSNI